MGTSPLGLVTAALLVGVGAGRGTVGFRRLISSVTWLATGYEEFGQQGRVGSREARKEMPDNMAALKRLIETS